MSSSGMSGDEFSSKEEYIKLLNEILRTDIHSKAAAMMEDAIGVKTKGQEAGDKKNISQCSLSAAIKSINNCIKNLQQTGDRLLDSFIETSEFNTKSKSPKSYPKSDFVRVSRTMLNTIIEAVTFSRRIHENALGLHVAVDFLRAPRDLDILNYSRSGRVPIQHYSFNEESNMSLNCLYLATTQLLKSLQAEDPKVPEECIKTFSYLKDAILHLRDSSQLTSQVFRVLMYCNIGGKKILQEFVDKLTPDEVNDIITELQTLRRKYDQVNILMEQLGWGLADILSKFTGKQITFETLIRAFQNKLKSFEDLNNNDSLPEGVQNLKNKIKAGLETFQKRSCTQNLDPIEQYKTLGKKVGSKSKIDPIKSQLDFQTKLVEIFGIKGNLTESGGTHQKTSTEKGSKANCTAFSPQNLKEGEPEICNIEDLNNNLLQEAGNKDLDPTASVSISSKSRKNRMKSLSRPPSRISTPSFNFSSRDDPESQKRNVILSKLFQEQFDGITHMMTESQIRAARVSFNKFLRQHAGDASFEFFKHKYEAKKRSVKTPTNK